MAAPATGRTVQPTPRVQSIDIVRGAVMVLMAIDHVRVFSGVPAGSPEAAVFLTRWITNFCAPAFVFFAGTSLFLKGERINDRAALARWVMLRGAWLVLLELTFLRLAWTFNADFTHYMLAGVIWMLGWCMILMGPLVRLPVAASAIFGCLTIAGHNLFASAVHGPLGWLGQLLYFGGAIKVGPVAQPNLLILYTIFPWIGVMAAGYAFGAVMRMNPEQRRRTCYLIGGGAILLFLVLRYFNLYGDRPWAATPRVAAWIAFLNTRKYPASLLFLLMTLGPAIAALPLLENARGRLAQWLSVFGRVPLFYYLLHIPLIHVVAVAISLVRTPGATGWLFGNHPMDPPPVPQGYMWSLGLLYAVTAAVVIALYFPCRWFARLKAQRRSTWLTYL
ncbi:MAG TPA: heparan-alpha-glucosaminide N-acetyltransferase domain-containing protein [Bryobacteraceae bacterium]|nr:heparan-alpha-glucosaminide N-acetyltransferase domain-containing protein [Bryobacteraceae bacterium]